MKYFIFLSLLFSLIVIGSASILTVSEYEDGVGLEDVKEKEDVVGEVKARQVIVRFEDSDAVLSEGLVEQIDSMMSLDSTTYVLTVKEGIDIQNVITQLSNEEMVETVEEDRLVQIMTVPNDPYRSEQWWLDTINIGYSWNYSYYQQEDVTVAVIDTGLDTTITDLANSISPNGYDFYNDIPYMSDANGHGTNVSSIIAAETNNQIGIAGVGGDFNIKILPLRVTDYRGNGYTSDVIKAIDYAIEQKADIINMSLGSRSYSESEHAAVQRAVEAGIIVVASAGNEAEKGNPIIYPAAYENVISVGSIDNNLNHSPFSAHNEFVDVVAPGEDIIVLDPFKDTQIVSGTSFATPIITGVLAIGKGVNGDLSIKEAETLLAQHATDLGEPGYDSQYGHGLINVEQLIQAIVVEQQDFLSTERQEMHVKTDKTFTIVFNGPVDLQYLHSHNIFVTKDKDNTKSVINIKLTIDEENPSRVHVSTETRWEPGEYTLYINDQVKSLNGKQHINNIKMRFIVTE